MTQSADTPRAPVEPLTAERAKQEATFSLYRKTASTLISDTTFPPGTVYQTPEGLRAEDEETRCAFDVQGGVYPIRESVFRESYALDAARAERDRDAVDGLREAYRELHAAASAVTDDGDDHPDGCICDEHERLRAALAATPTEQPCDDGGLRAELERVAPRPWSRHGAYGQFIRDANGVEVAVVAFQSGDERGPDNEADFDRTGIIAAALADGAPDS